jgi:hypothetical protein
MGREERVPRVLEQYQEEVKNAAVQWRRCVAAQEHRCIDAPWCDSDSDTRSIDGRVIGDESCPSQRKASVLPMLLIVLFPRRALFAASSSTG